MACLPRVFRLKIRLSQISSAVRRYTQTQFNVDDDNINLYSNVNSSHTAGKKSHMRCCSREPACLWIVLWRVTKRSE